MHHIYDLSHRLDESIQVYPGDPVFSCHKVATVKDDGYSVTGLSFGSHTGTHIDAPCHFLEGGLTIDQVDLSLLIGPAVVISILNKQPRERITWDDFVRAGILSLVQDHRILLVRTDWSKHWKTSQYLNHPFFDKEVAQELLGLGIRVFAVDTLSPDETAVDESSNDFGMHETILGSGTVIVENLTNLDQLQSDHVYVSLLPLAITGCDGSPIRAVAWLRNS